MRPRVALPTTANPPNTTLLHHQALFPLVNVPMIDYTIEFLAAAGVEEVGGAM